MLWPARGTPAQVQQPEPQQPAEVLVDPRAGELLGRKISVVRMLQVDRDGLHPLAESFADTIVRSLQTRAQQPFRLRDVTADIGSLWHERRLAVRVFAHPDGEQVEIRFVVEREVETYERVEFQGLHQYERNEVDVLLGLYPDRQVTSTEAAAMRNILLARYRRDGFAFASIALDEHEAPPTEVSGERSRKIVKFRIDEGRKVTIGDLHFRGNASFPALVATPFDPGDHLVRESHIQSSPAGWIGAGGPYSRELLEEDLDRLQLFYRSRGFLDAVVTVAEVHFREDHEVVDLDFLVVEGPRYVVRAIALVHIDAQGRELPPAQAAYGVEEIRAVLKTRVGDFYDHTSIRRDMLAIEDFYGERGHPKSSFPGMDRVPGSFKLGWPKERYDERAGVELTFEIEEGTEKTLRDVVIRGNTATRDPVIRRKVYALPGERLDMKKVQRSIAYLDSTQFFRDPLTLAGPRFELQPVPGRDDLVDLDIDVTEAPTGDLRWGVGISSGAGATASVSLNKKNFDLWSLPSSWNPVTVFSEVLDNRAFHGGGQSLDLLLAPGTQQSQFQIGYTQPDLFGDHFDTTELRVNGRRTLRFRDGYRTDILGAEVGLSRNFSDEWNVGVRLREESIEISDIAPEATSLVFDAEGRTELRGVSLSAGYRSFDDPRRPTEGVELRGTFEVAGGPFGAEVDLWKAVASAQVYAPLAENMLGHRTVLHFEQVFGVAQAFGSDADVFVTERFYLGGGNLRGFEPRRVGPSQFGQPLGGEATWYGTLETIHPLLATRLDRDVRDRELLRGVVFLDYGLLGLDLGDPTFHQLRLSYGVGLRIDVPVLGIPIALDVGWPILYEESDSRRQFWFSISR